MRRYLASTLLLGALTVMPFVATADDKAGHDLEELVVQMAHTPGDHAALAEHYHAKAAEARRMADRHEALQRVYTGGKFMQREAMKSHCMKIAADYNAMADEYEALAKLHEAESKKQ